MITNSPSPSYPRLFGCLSLSVSVLSDSLKNYLKYMHVAGKGLRQSMIPCRLFLESMCPASSFVFIFTVLNERSCSLLVKAWNWSKGKLLPTETSGQFSLHCLLGHSAWSRCWRLCSEQAFLSSQFLGGSSSLNNLPWKSQPLPQPKASG